jgi:predicted nucleotidyltransferase
LNVESWKPEDIAIYRRAFEQRAQARLRKKEELRLRARQAVVEAIETIALAYPTVQRVYLFGSVIRPGAFGPDSDVDIGLEGANTALCFDIWRDLEQAAPEWKLDVRSLVPDDLFSERIREKGEVIYDRSITAP